MTEPRGGPTGRSPARVTEAREALARLHSEAERLRDRAVSTRRDAQQEREATEYVVAVVPRHRARLRPLTRVRQEAFATRLRELVAFVQATSPEADERTLDHPAPLADAAAALVVATCSACRGKCCGNGGDHAFLRTRTIREFMAAQTALDAEAVVAAYLSHLPERSMHPGCVYQGQNGCTLPRSMRSAICNAYLCGGLERALGAAAMAAARGATTAGVYVAFREGGRLTGGRLRTLPVLASG